MQQKNKTACLSRRRFLAGCALAAAGCAAAKAAPALPAPGEPEPREALYYDQLGNHAVRCRLCPRGCVIPSGRNGHCRVRGNREGVLRSLVYGYPVSLCPDPIEKKPFFHVRPGTSSFSLATVGCNIACKFCQNYDIATSSPADARVPFRAPAEIVRLAQAAGCATLAFTYTEPIVFYEYMADCARAGRDLGLGSLMISNGFIEAAPLKALLPLMTAIKIDLKSFTEPFYKEVCSGRLQPVLDTIKRVHEGGVWLEIVTLLIPGLNDSPDEIKRLAAWLAARTAPTVPLHFSRFHPAYRMRNVPSTPYDTLRAARDLALREGCRFVYIGNAPGLGGEDTACPACGELVVTRRGYRIASNRLNAGACPACGKPVPGIWA